MLNRILYKRYGVALSSNQNQIQVPKLIELLAKLCLDWKKTFVVKLSPQYRSNSIKTASQEMFDVIIIGGGVTGAGIALDAQNRGLKVLLLEKGQFGSGTSSRSTKLIHAGIRYLKQGHINLVRETGKERKILAKIVPHLVKPIRIIIPIYKKDTLSPWKMRFGMKFFEWLVAVVPNEKSKWFSAQFLKKIVSGISTNQLLGGMSYYERLTTDSRLVLELVKKSAKLGASVLNYTYANDYQYTEDNKVVVKVDDLLQNSTFAVTGNVLINSAGPWVDHIRKKDTGFQHTKLTLTKGVHLVFDQSDFYLNAAVYFSGSDNRMIFAVPKFNKVYVGTTDTFYDEDPDDVKVEEPDANYLLDAINFRFPDKKITIHHIESTWAGLRPLIGDSRGKKPSEISRKDEIIMSSSGLYSIAGGKLTGYRLMAKKIVDLILKKEFSFFEKCTTDQLLLVENEHLQLENLSKELCTTYIDIDCLTIDKLIALFGESTKEILSQIKNEEQQLLDPIMKSVIDYVVENEGCTSPVDLVMIHTDWLYFEINWIIKEQQSIVDYMESLFKWSNDFKIKIREDFQTKIDEASLKTIKNSEDNQK